MDSATEFFKWAKALRDENCKVLTNDPAIGTIDESRTPKATIWSKTERSMPEEVTITNKCMASQDTPAVETNDVDGWYAYYVELS